MSTVLENPNKNNVLYFDQNVEQSAIINGLTWNSYQNFLKAFDESHAVHLTLDRMNIFAEIGISEV